MKPKLVLSLCVMSWLLLSSTASSRAQGDEPTGPEAALGSAITYQGRLNDGGAPADGSYDFQFILYNAESGGSQVGGLVVKEDVLVSDGYFTVQLDFGAGVFGSEACWLEVGVRPGASTGGFTTLSPRQSLTPAPTALYAPSAGSVPWSGISGMPAGFADGVDNDTTSFWGLAGNAGTNPGANYLGTSDNQALELRVNGQPALRLAPTGGTPNLVVGYSGNNAWAGVVGAVIAGGGEASYGNSITDSYGTVGGGSRNTAGDSFGTVVDKRYATVGGGYWNGASGTYATVGGGYSNDASGTYATVGGGWNNDAGLYATVAGGGGNTASYQFATVGGGYSNDASVLGATVAGGGSNTASGTYATVGGGQNNTASSGDATVAGGSSNTASGTYATVGGGVYNTASGIYATVPGGSNNRAEGGFSFAAGYRAVATTNAYGSFVWSDYHDFDTTSNAPNQFLVRATGGFWFGTAIDPSTGAWTAGASLAGGSSQWSQLSDRNLKMAFQPVNAQEIADNLAEMPIQTWSYIAQSEDIRHMGPMAQDFYAAFGLGEDDTHISTLDADGVALAAVQGLYQLVQEKDARIGALEAKNAALEARLAEIEAVLKELRREGQ